jgi:hypothetical protein
MRRGVAGQASAVRASIMHGWEALTGGKCLINLCTCYEAFLSVLSCGKSAKSTHVALPLTRIYRRPQPCKCLGRQGENSCHNQWVTSARLDELRHFPASLWNLAHCFADGLLASILTCATPCVVRPICLAAACERSIGEDVGGCASASCLA